MAIPRLEGSKVGSKQTTNLTIHIFCMENLLTNLTEMNIDPLLIAVLIPARMVFARKPSYLFPAQPL